MKRKAILSVFLFVLLIVLSGCSERKTFSGSSEEALLSGEEAFVSDKPEASEPVSDSEETSAAPQEESFSDSRHSSSAPESAGEASKAEKSYLSNAMQHWRFYYGYQKGKWEKTKVEFYRDTEKRFMSDKITITEYDVFANR